MSDSQIEVQLPNLYHTTHGLVWPADEDTPSEILERVHSLHAGHEHASRAHRAAAELRQLWREKEKTKAAILMHVDQVHSELEWQALDVYGEPYWETLDDWLDFALQDLPVHASDRSTIVAWATVLAPFLRSNVVTDKTTGARVSPEYCLAVAGWTKIADIRTAWYKLMKDVSLGRSKHPQMDMVEAGRRIRTTVQWAVDETVRRKIDNPTPEEKRHCLDCLLKEQGWRKSRTPQRPETLGGKPYSVVSYNGRKVLVVGELDEEELAYLVNVELVKTLGIDTSPLSYLGLEVHR